MTFYEDRITKGKMTETCPNKSPSAQLTTNRSLRLRLDD